MTRLLAKALALLVLSLAVAAPVAASTFLDSERTVPIGAHSTSVSPTVDGFVEFDAGPLVPRVRLPLDAPVGIGAQIRVGEAEINNLEELIARDAVIASQPEGEIAALRAAIADMARDAALRGLGVALLVAIATVLAWRAVGSRRREEIWASARRPGLARTGAAVGVSAAVVAAVVLVSLPDRPRPDDTTWAGVRDVFPELPDEELLGELQIAEGASTSGGRALVEGALQTYRDSLEFYGRLTEAAEDVEVRRPEEGQTTALVVTDRHDNIGMDPVARAVADRAEATLLIDLGDDTSTGGAWEEFSLNSLAREFDGFDVVAVAGNHDAGTAVVQQMDDLGFTVLDGESETVGGIDFIGGNDPRSSGLTAGYDGDEPDTIAAIRTQDDALTAAACTGEPASVAVVHSHASARDLSESGCVDLVLSGHLHRQVGPEEIVSPEGAVTTRLTTASTGGAVYAFALGSKLRREAQVTIVTFEDGRPVGLQPVSFTPGGTIEVADFTPVTLGDQARSDAARSDPR